MKDLLNGFVDCTRGKQLLIVHPTIVGMFYASNMKHSCFTGFWQGKPANFCFKYLDFLGAQALAGPKSFITCVFMEDGQYGKVRFLTLEKSTALS